MESKTLVFIVGVRGAGKSTLIDKLEAESICTILKPSTTRQPRDRGDQEYYFTDDWKAEDYEWEISIGSDKYGMLKSELQKSIDTPFQITVFDPSHFDVLQEYRRKSSTKRVITIGLDTIDSYDEQNKRVDSVESRKLTKKEFLKQTDVVKNCDVVMSGDEEEVAEAFIETLLLIISRGGVLQSSSISKLLKSGVLLKESSGKVEPASYDLRLGGDVWCQGKFIKLNSKNPFLSIPAYSYAIVSAKESANLPCFLSARFDLKNSLFFQGVILSNGPQIDPGYRGALFCMLYNGSDKEVGISHGDPFATIEFITTTGIDIGYRDRYQGKTELKDFMPATAAVSKGGQILERTEAKVEKLEKEWHLSRTIILAVLGIVIGPMIYASNNLWSSLKDTQKDYSALIAELQIEKQKMLDLRSAIINERNINESKTVNDEKDL